MTSKIFIQGTEAPWVRTFSPEISMGTMTSRDATNGFTKDLVPGVHVDLSFYRSRWYSWTNTLPKKKATSSSFAFQEANMQNHAESNSFSTQKFAEIFCKKKLQKKHLCFHHPRHSSEPQAGWIEPSEIHQIQASKTWNPSEYAIKCHMS